MTDTETLAGPEVPEPGQGPRRGRQNALWFAQSFVATLILAGLIWGGATLVSAFTTPVQPQTHPTASASPSKAHRRHLEPSESAPIPVATQPQTSAPVRHHKHHRKVVVTPTTPVPTTPVAQPTTPLPTPTFTAPAPTPTLPTATASPTSTGLPTGVPPTATEGATSDGPGDLHQESSGPLPHGAHARR